MCHGTVKIVSLKEKIHLYISDLNGGCHIVLDVYITPGHCGMVNGNLKKWNYKVNFIILVSQEKLYIPAYKGGWQVKIIKIIHGKNNLVGCPSFFPKCLRKISVKPGEENFSRKHSGKWKNTKSAI